MRSSRLTHFIASYVPGLRLDSLCFGTPVHQYKQSQERTVYQFEPGQIFGVVWWRRYPDDRQQRALAIIQAIERGQAGHRMPGIQKAVAVHAIVNQLGPAGQDGAVDRLLDLIEDLKNHGQQPEKLPPIYWTEAVYHILLYPELSDSPIA